MSVFTDIDAAIMTRLESKLSTLDPKPRLYSARDLANVKDRSQGDLAVYVTYNGIVGATPLNNAPHVVTLEHEWYIWTVGRSAKDHANSGGTREMADPVLERIMESLTGWSAAPGVRLELKPNPGPAYGDGFGWFPLVYGAKRQIRGNPN